MVGRLAAAAPIKLMAAVARVFRPPKPSSMQSRTQREAREKRRTTLQATELLSSSDRRLKGKARQQQPWTPQPHLF